MQLMQGQLPYQILVQQTPLHPYQITCYSQVYFQRGQEWSKQYQGEEEAEIFGSQAADHQRGYISSLFCQEFRRTVAL